MYTFCNFLYICSCKNLFLWFKDKARLDPLIKVPQIALHTIFGDVASPAKRSTLHNLMLYC